MVSIKDRVANGLNEAYILILGVQIMIGFQYRSAFDKGFSELPYYSQYLKLGGLALMLISFALLVSPLNYHLISEDGNNTLDLSKFINRVMWLALLPFALGLGIDVYVSFSKIVSPFAGIMGGVIVLLFALFFWYGIEYLKTRGQPSPANPESESEKPMELKDEIREVLTEARMVLPGAQALLGFQFATILVEGFEKLPQASQYLHLGALVLVAISVILLMAPPAYHRLVEKGENTKKFLNFAERVVIGSTIPLALGICVDYFIVSQKITHSMLFSIITSSILLVLFYGLWFGYTGYVRNSRI